MVKARRKKNKGRRIKAKPQIDKVNVRRTLAKKKLKKYYSKHVLLEKEIYKQHKDKLIEYNRCVRRLCKWLAVYQPRVRAAVFVRWTEEDWRRRHRPSAKLWTKWQLEIMPKSIQPQKETLIQCIACKEHAVTFYLKQTRSADEPMTRFNTCTSCGKEWRCES